MSLPAFFSRSLRRWPALLLSALMLAACSSKPPPREAPDPPSRDFSSVPDEIPQPPAPRRSGGGYYLDDGPDDQPPDNLHLVPDAVPRVEPLHRFANRPYTVFGRKYQPMTNVQPHRQRGVASWYGRRFHGNPTSSGEPYDMYAMTAAHPTLPIPSYVRVTSVANGRSVVVRVNDRGPFKRDRVIDLSYTAAHRLGFIEAGSAEVEVELILPGQQMAETGGAGASAPTPPRVLPPVAAAPPPPVPAAAPPPVAAVAPAVPVPSPAPSPAPSAVQRPVATTPPAAVDVANAHFLQLGVFSVRDNAEALVERVRREFAWLVEQADLLNEGSRYRVRIGPWRSAEEARSAARQLGEALQVEPFVVQR